MNNNYLRVENITKTFGEVIANQNVNLYVDKGEVLAVLGENGAGKSTLMNMIAGVYLQNSGRIYIENKVVNIDSPKSAKDLGIGMIHQRFKLINTMTGLENVLLGHDTEIFIKKTARKKQIIELMNKFDISVDLNKYIFNMSMGEKQMLEIIKVLYRGAKLLILDEPTTVLTPRETDILFSIVNSLKEMGHAVIFISHKLNEVLAISDRVSILREGKSIATVVTNKTNRDELIKYMVGKAISLDINRTDPLTNEPILELLNVTAKNNLGLKALDKVSFTVNKGEVLGVAGISGHGQMHICESIVGIHKVESGEIIFNGKNIEKLTAREILMLEGHISYVPQDRLGMGLVPSMSITENILLREYVKQGFIIERSSSVAISKNMIKDLEIQTTGVDQKVSLMSGGNIQKVLLGRELNYNPDLLILSYPVRGLDINTTFKIYDLINEHKANGVGILYIAEDLDFLIALCDRILILHHGTVAKIVDARNTSKEEIGRYMLGDTEVNTKC